MMIHRIQPSPGELYEYKSGGKRYGAVFLFRQRDFWLVSVSEELTMPAEQITAETAASPSQTSGRAIHGSTPSAPSPFGTPQSGTRCPPPVSQPNGAERSRVQIRMQGIGLPVPLCRSTVGAARAGLR